MTTQKNIKLLALYNSDNGDLLFITESKDQMIEKLEEHYGKSDVATEVRTYESDEHGNLMLDSVITEPAIIDGEIWGRTTTAEPVDDPDYGTYDTEFDEIIKKNTEK